MEKSRGIETKRRMWQKREKIAREKMVAKLGGRVWRRCKS
jgi:hypothetical protein